MLCIIVPLGLIHTPASAEEGASCQESSNNPNPGGGSEGVDTNGDGICDEWNSRYEQTCTNDGTAPENWTGYDEDGDGICDTYLGPPSQSEQPVAQEQPAEPRTTPAAATEVTQPPATTVPVQAAAIVSEPSAGAETQFPSPPEAISDEKSMWPTWVLALAAGLMAIIALLRVRSRKQ